MRITERVDLIPALRPRYSDTIRFVVIPSSIMVGRENELDTLTGSGSHPERLRYESYTIFDWIRADIGSQVHRVF